MFDKEPIPTQTRIIEHVFTHNLYNIHTILLTCSNCCTNSVSDPGEDQEGWKGRGRETLHTGTRTGYYKDIVFYKLVLVEDEW